MQDSERLAKQCPPIAGSALLNGVTADVVRQANNYSAQHVAVTCWAFAKLEITPRSSLMQVSLLSGSSSTVQKQISSERLSQIS